MSYNDIIRENSEKHSPVSWWPLYAYHYTDVTNAVSILSSGFLYSRADAANLNIMKNDNASRQVIDMTNPSVVSKVRFYFRPLTPTQYYNEGYKHRSLRYYQDTNANVPVPVFLLFDLNKLLSIEGVQFSEKSQAGRGADVYSGVEAFSKLRFDYIYDNKYENFEMTKSYRHAEIVHPNSLKIDSCISYILCRNDIERTTLLNLLRKTDSKVFFQYKDIIKVSKRCAFENNGFFITGCSFHNHMVSISFSDTYASHRYIQREMEKAQLNYLKPINVTVLLKWFNSKTVNHQESIKVEVDICNPKMLSLRGLPDVHKAKNISIEVYFEDKLMCYIEQPLDSAELCR